MPRIHDIIKMTPDGLILSVKAKPATAKERAVRLVDIGDGAMALEVSVPACAHDGKANKALCERLAKLFGVSKTRVLLKSGAKARLKVFLIDGDPAVLAMKLSELLERVSTRLTHS
ncbi:MAG: DUF167 domain-containing protein [Alphaproteobacteria bacterium]|nr:DUF167 domain-containing protein [Alphaproteobacteria bacterium]